ncbi:MAG: hypothetical protein WD029_06430 [Microthrixaceae bacterium]
MTEPDPRIEPDPRTEPHLRIGVPSQSRWLAGLPAVCLGWVWARLCIASGYATANLLVDRMEVPLASGMSRPTSLQQGWFMWDGAFYRGLAQQWYSRPQLSGLSGAGGSSGILGEEARFFPVYPALGRLIGPLIGGHADWALIAIANLAAFLGAWVLWKLVTEVLGDDHPAANRSAVLVAIFPAAFVLAFAYSEGLALLVVAGALLALQRRNFVFAGSLALLAASIRPVGGLLLIPIAIELIRARPRPSWWKWVIGLGGPFVGLGLALLWIERSTREFLLPLRLQQQLRGGFQDPITRVLEPVGEIFRGNFRDVYNLGFMIVFLLLFLFMVLGIRSQAGSLPVSLPVSLHVSLHVSLPVSWVAYSGVSLLLLLSSQVTDSLGRYGLLVPPFIVALALWTDRRWRSIAIGVTCSAGLIWLTSEAFLGRLVP